MRTLEMNKMPNIRMWFESTFPEIWGDRRKRVDIIFAKVDPEIKGWDYDYDHLVPRTPLVALEVKYANTAYEEDFKKLTDLKAHIPSIAPIFVYLNFTTITKRSSMYETITDELKDTDIGLLYGDADNHKKWKSAFLARYLRS